MAEYIERAKATEFIYKCLNHEKELQSIERETLIAVKKCLESIPAADVRPVPEGGIGEMSDGYHTFSGLYYQRMVLFSALVKAYRDKSWKSHRHEDGGLCFGGGWFIVGIDTPDGSYTYHYEDKDWDRFDCQELPTAKTWDGHAEEDVTRILSLPDVRPVVRGRWKPFDLTFGRNMCYCSACEQSEDVPTAMGVLMFRFCPNCGAEMEVQDGKEVTSE